LVIKPQKKYWRKKNYSFLKNKTMQKNIELSNKESIVLNIPMHDHDKRVFVTTDQTGLITGLNFHFGVDDTTAQDLQFLAFPVTFNRDI